MQKNNKKASILLWTIMVSMMLSFLFISLSDKVNQNIKQNISINEKINIEESIKNSIENIETNYKEIYNEAKKINPDLDIINKKFDNIEIFKSFKNIEIDIESLEKKKKIEEKNLNPEIDLILNEIESLKKIWDDKNIEKLINKIKEKREKINNIEKEISEKKNIFKSIKRYNIEIDNNKLKLSSLWNKITIYTYPNSNIDINYSWDVIYICKKINCLDNDFEPIRWEKSYFTDNKIEKLTIKNSWWYSKIDIISNRYIIYENIYFKVLEKFWKKENIKSDWFFKVK